jgi:hypothetical protein
MYIPKSTGKYIVQSKINRKVHCTFQNQQESTLYIPKSTGKYIVLACKPQFTALYKISVQALFFVHLLIFLMFTGLYKTDFYFQSSDIQECTLYKIVYSNVQCTEPLVYRNVHCTKPLVYRLSFPSPHRKMRCSAPVHSAY